MLLNQKVLCDAGVLNEEAIDRAAEQIESFGESLNMERRIILRTRLYVEELLLRWLDRFGPGMVFSITLGYRLRQPYIGLELVGDVCNPLVEGTEDDWDRMLLTKLGRAPSFSYQRGKNCVFLPLERPRLNPALKLLAVIAGAVIVGGTGLLLLDGGVLELLSGSVLRPLYNAFFRLLNLAAGPVVFLSVLTTVYEVGCVSVLGDLWAEMSSRFIARCALLTVITAALALPVFSLSMTYYLSGSGQFASVLDLLLNIVPNDPLSPFLNGDSPSLILLAILLADIVLAVDRNSGRFEGTATMARTATRKILDLVNSLSGWIIFVVVLLHLWTVSLHVMTSLWKPLVLSVALSAVYLGVTILYVSAREKLSPVLLVKKLMRPFLTALSTGSVVSANGEAAACCEKRLGVSPMVVRYGIPLGSTVFMPGEAMNALLICFSMAEFWEIPVSALWVVIAVLLTTVLAIASPPISGVGLITYAAIFTQLGIPADGLAAALVADILMGFVASALDQTLLQLELVVQADRMQLLNRDTLRSPGNP